MYSPLLPSLDTWWVYKILLNIIGILTIVFQLPKFGIRFSMLFGFALVGAAFILLGWVFSYTQPLQYVAVHTCTSLIVVFVNPCYFELWLRRILQVADSCIISAHIHQQQPRPLNNILGKGEWEERERKRERRESKKPVHFICAGSCRTYQVDGCLLRLLWSWEWQRVLAPPLPSLACTHYSQSSSPVVLV